MRSQFVFSESVGTVIVKLLFITSLQNHAHAQSVYLSLGSFNFITNNTEIPITRVGENIPGGLPSLVCHTDLTECCRGIDTGVEGGLGEWYYPDGRVVQKNSQSRENFYRVKNAPQIVRLARRVNSPNLSRSPNGSYCCVIPTTQGEMTFCANFIPIYDLDGPWPVICELLPPLTNGMVSYSESTPYLGTVATYTCNPGFVLIGDNSRICQYSNWSGSAPTCEDPMVTVIFGTSAVAGQDFSLTCFVIRASTVDLTYQLIQNVSGETVVRGTQTTPVFTFNPLLLSDGGLYSCNATVTTPTSSLTITSETDSLFVQIPPPIVSVIDPGHVLTTESSLQLDCMITVNHSIVNAPVTIGVEWNTSRGISFSRNVLSESIVLAAIHTSINVTDSGNYSCKAMVFSTYGVAVTGMAKRSLSVVFKPDTIAVLFQLKLIHINKDCPKWIITQGSNFSSVAGAEINQHCQCEFTSKLVMEAGFRCFVASPTTVTYRARLEDSNFLPAIQNWIRDDGILLVHNALVAVDKLCPVIISNFTEPYCIGTYTGEDEDIPTSSGDGHLVATICGVVGVLVILFIVVLLVIIVVTRHKHRSSARKFIPSVSHKDENVVSDSQPHNIMMRKMNKNTAEIALRGNEVQSSFIAPATEKYENWSITVNTTSKKLPTKAMTLPPLSSQNKRPPTHHLVDLQPTGPAMVESRSTKCAAYYTVRRNT